MSRSHIFVRNFANETDNVKKKEGRKKKHFFLSLHLKATNVNITTSTFEMNL